MSTVKAKNHQIGADGTASNNFTIYQPSTPDGTSRWAVGVSGATTADVVTVNSSGNVGIGTTSPNNRLIVNGAVGVAGEAAAAISNGCLIDQTAGFLTRILNYSSTTGSAIALYTGSTGTSTERMRIDSSGGVSIGATATYLGTERFSVTATAAGWPMSLNCTTSAANGLYIRYSTSPNNTGSDFFAAVDSTATRVVFRSNGGLANYSGNNVNLSDQREKTNIELAGSYLDKICAIPVKTFNYIDQNMEEDGGLTLGVIAQDVQAVAPELVMESNWASKDEPEKLRLSIYQTDLQYALMKCIQEQQAIIETLKADIDALKAKVN